jgi:dTDP-L-rhamnose 4-epimerase
MWPMRVLVTGGAGFIGSLLAESLGDASHEVVALDALHPQVHRSGGRPSALPKDTELILGDVTDPAQWDRTLRLIGKPDVVVHLAAETGTGQSLRESSRHGRVNVVGTTELLDALARADSIPQHIVLTSSRAVYGEGAWEGQDGCVFYPPPRDHAMLARSQWDPVDPTGAPAKPLPHSAPTTWPRPTNVYAATKLAQEHVLGSWCAAFGVALSVLRLQNVYGPGQAVGNAYTGVLTFFAGQVGRRETIDVYEDGRIMRDFVFVSDVVDALSAAIAHPPSSTRTVDVGGGRSVDLLSVARTMAQIGGAPDPVISGKYRDGDVRSAWADIAPTTGDLGWRPAVNLDDGLERLIEWVRRQG